MNMRADENAARDGVRVAIPACVRGSKLGEAFGVGPGETAEIAGIGGFRHDEIPGPGLALPAAAPH